uniref:Uncharacterized protein n=1 Tax=Branchiostoma floridae TaxID=7739 RepID=C3YY57_BRAFL|eukprot:XP_002599004.1 hypothetical protein BRAFLDRAFT_79937 [Branchiostoma floridae]
MDITPNPMYTQSTMNPSPNDINPNPMYLQSTVEPYAVKYLEDIADSANNDSDTYIQPYAVGYQKDDEPPIGTSDCESAASSSLNNDALTNLSSNGTNPSDLVGEERQHVPNALHPDPNPMYVPNVQHPAACATCAFGDLVCYTSFALLDFVLRVAYADVVLLEPAETVTPGTPGCCSSVPTPPGVSNSSQRTESYPQLTVASTLTTSQTGSSGSVPTPPAVSKSSQLKGETSSKLRPESWYGGFN